MIFLRGLWWACDLKLVHSSTVCRIPKEMFSRRRSRTVEKRCIIVGLKDDNCSREVLLRLLNLVAMAGDNVLAIHVQEPDGCDFDPNTFHIHEDVCKSKQVDFQVKVCTGRSYMIALSHQVRTNFATILALGCSSSTTDDLEVFARLKALPPTCYLLVMDSVGKILVMMPGTSQEGSLSTDKVLKSSLSTPSKSSISNKSVGQAHLIRKSSSMPASSSKVQIGNSKNSKMQLFMTQKIFQRLATLDIIGSSRRFTSEQLRRATNDFSPEYFIGEGGHSIVYRAKLENDQVVAVKVFKSKDKSFEDDFFQEVGILSRIKHENVIQLIGYCYSQDLQAVVCNLMKGSLKQRLNHLGWHGRMIVAIHVAKALDYLHSCSPPIIHRYVKSSNILLSDNYQPQLSDFGAAILHNHIQKVSTHKKPIDTVHKKTLKIVGTFGYMAPEYMMYGSVDEKIDVYSYRVVLLELITGKAAIQTNQASQHESLVLWARSLLATSSRECLIDPSLNENYDKDEITTMITAARLCLLDSSSSRPTMKTILHLLEEQEQWSEKQKKKDDLIDQISLRGEWESSKFDDSDSTDTISIIDEN